MKIGDIVDGAGWLIFGFPDIDVPVGGVRCPETASLFQLTADVESVVIFARQEVGDIYLLQHMAS